MLRPSQDLTIRAANPGMAILDGQGASSMILDVRGGTVRLEGLGDRGRPAVSFDRKRRRELEGRDAEDLGRQRESAGSVPGT